jgi:bisphosphoglycerate-dependent phosphoglycerate mutase
MDHRITIGGASEVEKQILKPKYTDKGGGIHDAREMNIAVTKDFLKNPKQYLTDRGKDKMETQTKMTDKLFESHVTAVNTGINQLISAEKKFDDASKSVSQSVRKNTESLKQGLERIQKQADFNSLERYVSLLERASVAIESLAKIHDSGKLEKIGNALK